MYQDHMRPWDHFWSHWFQLWGKQETLEIYSQLEEMIVIIVVKEQAWWFLFEIFLEYEETPILVTQHQLQMIIQKQKGVKD